LGATHNYKNSRAAKLAIYELGEDIKAGKLPAHFGPLSFVFSGSGNVSQVICLIFFHLKECDLILHVEQSCSIIFIAFV